MANGWGGPRPNSGRKPGSLTRYQKIARAMVQGTNYSPLEYMLKVMRDETAPSTRRDMMAIAAAPYIHPKFAVVAYKDATEDNPVQKVVKIERHITLGPREWEDTSDRDGAGIPAAPPAE